MNDFCCIFYIFMNDFCCIFYIFMNDYGLFVPDLKSRQKKCKVEENAKKSPRKAIFRFLHAFWRIRWVAVFWQYLHKKDTTLYELSKYLEEKILKLCFSICFFCVYHFFHTFVASRRSFIWYIKNVYPHPEVIPKIPRR